VTVNPNSYLYRPQLVEPAPMENSLLMGNENTPPAKCPRKATTFEPFRVQATSLPRTITSAKGVVKDILVCLTYIIISVLALAFAVIVARMDGRVVEDSDWATVSQLCIRVSMEIDTPDLPL
jgi:hypothetical protein